MKYFPLVWSSLFRRKVRTLFTLLSIMIAFVLFNYLSAVSVAFSMGVDVAGSDRLMLIHRVSFTQLLPESYQERIRAVDGVTEVTHQTWFGGVYQDPRNFFAQFAVEPEGYLSMYPELRLPDDAKERWLHDRTGAVVSRSLADRFDWEVGDRIPLQGTIWRTRSGNTWEFTIDGIYDGAEGINSGGFLLRYDYLDQANSLGRGFVGNYVIRIDEPSRAVEIGAAIDTRFANSPYETKTSTEQAFVQAFANQIGDVGTMMTAIMIAVLFTILLVTANTMAQSVRERTSELAVLKTLGFTDRRVLSLVLVESILLAVVGGGVGLGLSWMLIQQQGDPTGGLLPAFFVPPRDLVIGVGLTLCLGIASGILPGVHAVRLRIVDALRRT